jgi:CBS domain-containing protein
MDMFSTPVRSLIDPHKLLVATSESTVREAAELMASRGVGAVLVVDRDELLGIFTERDVVFRVVACGLDPDATRLSTVMTREPKTIAPDKSYGVAMAVMHENGFRHLPVVDKGVPIGVVSSRSALDPELEEFVAEERRRKRLLEQI